MIIAIVGSGGKTTLLKKLAEAYRCQGKRVFVTTTTHMFLEEGMVLSDDPAVILSALAETSCVVAGIPMGNKIGALTEKTFEAVCRGADVVLVEADGSRQMPLKFPNATEPVIPKHTDQILVVCGLNALGQSAKDVCHRLELVKTCLDIEEDTLIEPAHIQKLVTEGYLKPLRQAYPNAKISVSPRHDGSPYQQAVACLLQNEQDVSLIQEAWFGSHHQVCQP